MRDEPYTVIVDDKPCKHCDNGMTWTIEGPDGIAIGRSFYDKEDAEDLADDMNHAFGEGQAAA